MRSFPPLFANEKNRKRGAAPFYILECPFPSTGTIYLSERVVAFSSWKGGVVTKSWIAAWGQITEDISDNAALTNVSTFELEAIIDPRSPGEDIEAIIELSANKAETTDCSLYLAFYDLVGSAESENPPQLLWKGNITDWEKIDDLIMRIEMADCSVRLDKYIGTKLNLADYPDAHPDDVGKTMNIIYGANNMVTCLRADWGARTTLKTGITETDTALELSDASLFPSSGTVTIDNENISYASITGNTLNSLTRGANGTTASSHGIGAQVWEVRSQYDSIIAGHAIKNLVAAYAEIDGYRLRVTSGVSSLLSSGRQLLRAISQISVAPVDSAKLSDPGHEHSLSSYTNLTGTGSSHYSDSDWGSWLWTGADASVRDGSAATYLQASFGPEVGDAEATITVNFSYGASAPSAVYAVITHQTKVWNYYTPLRDDLGAFVNGILLDRSDTRVTQKILLGTSVPSSLTLTVWHPGSPYNPAGIYCICYEIYLEVHTSSTSYETTGVVLNGGTVYTKFVERFHALVDGYEDDSSGTITGTPNAIITRPDHVFKHFLYTYASWPVAEFYTNASFGSSYLFSMVLNEYKKFKAWLAKMAWECRCYFRFHAGHAQLLYRPDSMHTEIDLMEYPTNSRAQEAYVSSCETNNITVDEMEYASDSAAQAAFATSSTTPANEGTGGTITHAGGYTIHTFTSGGTFNPGKARKVDYLVVAGGGGGGGGYNGGGGGGGGGGVLTGTIYKTAGNYTVTVGAGGSGGGGGGTGGNGGNSVFDTITSTGGGGAFSSSTGGNGGSGAGGGCAKSTGCGGGSGVSGQGHNGGSGQTDGGWYWYGGGGGGAGAAGSGLTGGAGVASSISGRSQYYGGGGGGGGTGTYGGGGAGGGGRGANGGSGAVAGTANTGGGGGGYGAAGGSGIVIIRYKTEYELTAFSDTVVKYQGDYSLKCVAVATGSLNKTLTRTLSPTIDLSGTEMFYFAIRSSLTGSNIKVGIHDSGGTTAEVIPNIIHANTWQIIEVDLSGVSDADKDAIDQIKVTVVNADSTNTFNLDDMYAGELSALKAYSEDTQKTQGSYSLKVIAQTNSLNETLTRTVTPAIDLTDAETIKYDIRASRTGINLTLALHNSDGTWISSSPDIIAADTFQTVSIDVSSIPNENKNAIDQFKITVINADTANNVRIDYCHSPRAETIPAAEVAMNDTKTTVRVRRSPLDEVINKISLHYNRDATKHGDEAYAGLLEGSDSASIDRYGEKEQPDLFKFDFVQSETMAERLLAFYLTRYKDRRKLVEMQLFLDNVDLEFADAVELAFLSNLLCEVQKVNIRPGSARDMRNDSITLIAKEY